MINVYIYTTVLGFLIYYLQLILVVEGWSGEPGGGGASLRATVCNSLLYKLRVSLSWDA